MNTPKAAGGDAPSEVTGPVSALALATGSTLRVLVACEYSATVRDAFRALGHDAWSCDLLPSERDPRWHIQGDVIAHLEDMPPCHYDLLIGHPLCTYLAVSGARWWKGREVKQWRGLRFFLDLYCAPVMHIALENPIGAVSKRFRPPDQIIQPWQFGHGETKATALWLRNLPPLMPTHRRNDFFAQPEPIGREQRIHKLPPGPDRWKERSRTFAGIAAAMADQWGGFLTNHRLEHRPGRDVDDAVGLLTAGSNELADSLGGRSRLNHEVISGGGSVGKDEQLHGGKNTSDAAKKEVETDAPIPRLPHAA